MTTDEALERLRPDWVIGKGVASPGGPLGWSVCQEFDGSIWRIGLGVTIAEAIEDAERSVAEEERQAAERRTDYERRKAAGQLTPIEIASEHVISSWATRVIQAIERPLAFSRLVDRSHEAEAKG